MSVEIKRLAQRIGKSGYPVGGQILADLGRSLEKGNLIPKRLPKDETISEKEPSVELDLENEWQRQAETLAGLFAKELGLTKKEYFASLPQFEPQPENFKGRFDIPVVVETRIPVKRQCKLAGIEYFLDGLDVTDWTNDAKGYRTPDRPYVTWLQDGEKNLNGAVEAVRKELAEDERGGTEFDGIALCIAHPQVLKKHFLDLPGTVVGSDRAPFLRLWRGGPLLSYDRVGDASPRFGSVSCGREIKT